MIAITARTARSVAAARNVHTVNAQAAAMPVLTSPIAKAATALRTL